MQKDRNSREPYRHGKSAKRLDEQGGNVRIFQPSRALPHGVRVNAEYRRLSEESGRRRSRFRSEADQDSGGKPITHSRAKPISDSRLKAISDRPPAEW
jgi:hypothetical protein